MQSSSEVLTINTKSEGSPSSSSKPAPHLKFQPRSKSDSGVVAPKKKKKKKKKLKELEEESEDEGSDEDSEGEGSVNQERRTGERLEEEGEGEEREGEDGSVKERRHSEPPGRPSANGKRALSSSSATSSPTSDGSEANLAAGGFERKKSWFKSITSLFSKSSSKSSSSRSSSSSSSPSSPVSPKLSTSGSLKSISSTTSNGSATSIPPNPNSARNSNGTPARKIPLRTHRPPQEPSPLSSEFSRPLTFEKRAPATQTPVAELKKLPQSLDFNTSGISFTVTEEQEQVANRREASMLAQYNSSRRKLSPIPSVDSEEDHSHIRQSISASSILSFTDDEEVSLPSETTKKKLYVFNNPTITNELVAQKLNKLDDLDFGDRATSGRPWDHNPVSLDNYLFAKIDSFQKADQKTTEKAERPEKAEPEKRFVKPEFGSSNSSLRLEVPTAEPRKRRSSDSTDYSLNRSSFGSSSSSSLSRPNSAEMDFVPTPVPVEDTPVLLRSSSNQSNLHFVSPPVIIEQPEPNQVVVEYEPRRQASWRKRSLPKRSLEGDSLFPIPVVLVDSGAVINQHSKTMTLGRKALRKHKALLQVNSQAPFRRTKSDPALGSLKETSHVTIFLGGLKKSNSQMLVNNKAAGQTQVQAVSRLMEEECRKFLFSIGISLSDFLEGDLMNGVILMQLLSSLKLTPTNVAFTENPVNIQQQQDNVALFLQTLSTLQPPPKTFALPDLFSEPKLLPKVYGCILSLRCRL